MNGPDDAAVGRQTGESWEWMRAAQGGDRAAFGRLYQRYQPQIHAFVRRRVPDAGLAEDLTSETFLRALRRIDTLTEQRADPGAWLATIARNLVVDHAKSARNRMEWVTDEVPEPRAGFSSEPSVEEQAQARAERVAATATVASCLHTLTPDQRRAVRLYDLSPARSVGEAATVMARTAGAVKALRHRGVRAMREQLTGQGLSSSHDCLHAATATHPPAGRHTPAPHPVPESGSAVQESAVQESAVQESAVQESAVEESVEESVAEMAAAVGRVCAAVDRLRVLHARTVVLDPGRAERLARWHTDDQSGRDSGGLDSGWRDSGGRYSGVEWDGSLR